jgi:hypothetical protein
MRNVTRAPVYLSICLASARKKGLLTLASASLLLGLACAACGSSGSSPALLPGPLAPWKSTNYLHGYLFGEAAAEGNDAEASVLNGYGGEQYLHFACSDAFQMQPGSLPANQLGVGTYPSGQADQWISGCVAGYQAAGG